MLETIREYARERGEGSVETRRSSRARDVLLCARRAAYLHRFDAEAEWAERLDIDHDDLRAACDWLAVGVGTSPGARGALGWFWFTHGYLVEARQRLADVLERSLLRGRLELVRSPRRVRSPRGAVKSTMGMPCSPKR